MVTIIKKEVLTFITLQKLNYILPFSIYIVLLYIISRYSICVEFLICNLCRLPRITFDLLMTPINAPSNIDFAIDYICTMYIIFNNI